MRSVVRQVEEAIASGDRDAAGSGPRSGLTWGRRRAEHFMEPRLERNLALADLLKTIGEKHNASAGEVAIAWTLTRPAVSCALVGIRRLEHLEGLQRAVELEPFSCQIRRQLEQFE